MIRKIKRYGWIPDLPDKRDFKYGVFELGTLPMKVDLRPQCPGVYDQLTLGSCTANAIAAAIEFERMKQQLPLFIPSRLFIYYNERDIEGSVDQDSGASIRDGIKSVNSQGACSEDEWPYDVSQFAVKPTGSCYQDALKDRALQYSSIDQSLSQMKGCLASGYPFVFGFTVYESFESDPVAKTGVVPMPGPNESTLGGHAVMGVGYDESLQAFIVRNSWGPDWGMAGYFTLPYEYLTDLDLSDDFWTIRLISTT